MSAELEEGWFGRTGADVIIDVLPPEPAPDELEAIAAADEHLLHDVDVGENGGARNRASGLALSPGAALPTEDDVAATRARPVLPQEGGAGMSDRAGNYSRVYWSIQTDPRFDGVRDVDARLGLWLRLLLLAEKTYPSPAPIPSRTNRRNLAILVERGLIERVGRDEYIVHGLRAERVHRAYTGRAGGVQRVLTAERGPRGRFVPVSPHDPPAFAGPDAGAGPETPDQRLLDQRSSEEEEEEEEEEEREERTHYSGPAKPDRDGASAQRTHELETEAGYRFAMKHVPWRDGHDEAHPPEPTP
jgi:hypothetical protein